MYVPSDVTIGCVLDIFALGVEYEPCSYSHVTSPVIVFTSVIVNTSV